jgi:hypothetical protein
MEFIEGRQQWSPVRKLLILFNRLVIIAVNDPIYGTVYLLLRFVAGPRVPRFEVHSLMF